MQSPIDRIRELLLEVPDEECESTDTPASPPLLKQTEPRSETSRKSSERTRKPRAA